MNKQQESFSANSNSGEQVGKKRNSEIHAAAEVESWIVEKEKEGLQVSRGHSAAHPPNYFAGRLESIRTEDNTWVWAEDKE